MATPRLLTDEFGQQELSLHGSHPMDSSRILLGLMMLSQEAEAAEEQQTDMLEGAISQRVLRSLMSALQFRDVATVRHSRQVAMLAVGIAQTIGWEHHHLKRLEVAALLHDIGKIGVPDNILFKPGRLSPDEQELMSLHQLIGTDVLQACRVDKEVLQIVSQSHTHYNGANDGFERIGSEVHQGARILAVADAYESLSTDQVYRNGKPHEEIMKILRDAAGTQFDGNIISSLSRWMEGAGQSYLKRAQEIAASDPYGGQIDPDDALEATSLGHIFSYLYLLESLYDGFYIVNSDMQFVVWNRGMESLFGHDALDILQRKWNTELLPHTDQFGEAQLKERDCPVRKAMETGRASTTTVQIRTLENKWLRVELQTVPLVDRKGTLHGAAEIVLDVSEDRVKPQSYRDLKLAATRDALTSVANRGELETQLMMMLSEYTKRTDPEPFSVIFLDVDFFKKINDNYDHQVGDQVLIDVSRLLQHETYSGELVGRYGGEEFVVVCPEADLPTTVRRADRLRNTLSRTPMGGDLKLKVTASFGVAQIEPGDSVQSLLRRADQALYEAKHTGRNKTCSLTTADIEGEAEKKKQARQKAEGDPFLFESSFDAFVASDMLVYKLNGFITDQEAKLIDVNKHQAQIRVGKAGFLTSWGKSEDKQPVEMMLRFNHQPPEAGSRGAGKVVVSVEIKPQGRIREATVFQNRARSVLRELKAYFVA